jgi:hypothetical protein
MWGAWCLQSLCQFALPSDRTRRSSRGPSPPRWGGLGAYRVFASLFSPRIARGAHREGLRLRDVEGLVPTESLPVCSPVGSHEALIARAFAPAMWRAWCVQSLCQFALPCGSHEALIARAFAPAMWRAWCAQSLCQFALPCGSHEALIARVADGRMRGIDLPSYVFVGRVESSRDLRLPFQYRHRKLCEECSKRDCRSFVLLAGKCVAPAACSCE